MCVRNTTTYTQPVSLNGFFFFYKKNTNTEWDCVNNTLIYTPIQYIYQYVLNIIKNLYKNYD